MRVRVLPSLGAQHRVCVYVCIGIPICIYMYIYVHCAFVLELHHQFLWIHVLFGLRCQWQVCEAWIRNCILQIIVGCNQLSLTDMSGAKVLIYLPISFRIALRALRKSFDRLNASEINLKDMDEID